jgi:serine/threonine protein kinase
MIGQRISHYRILEKLDEGGMGVVYKAEDTKLKRTVALKFLPPTLTRDPEAKERFFVEAQAAAALNHPNIGAVYAIEEVDDDMFIVMEYIDGQELKQKIDAGPMELDESLDIALQIAGGLKEAHEKGVIHRDINSSNIMLTKSGQVKIMDFGLARVQGGIGRQITKIGTILGTTHCMSPEQVVGKEVDRRTDIWSFGVVFYEMLTGQLPFKEEYEAAVIYSIQNDEPTPVTELRTGLPKELPDIVRKTLAKKPSERYPGTEGSRKRGQAKNF